MQDCLVVNLENVAKEVIVVVPVAEINMKIDSFTPVLSFSN